MGMERIIKQSHIGQRSRKGEVMIRHKHFIMLFFVPLFSFLSILHISAEENFPNLLKQQDARELLNEVQSLRKHAYRFFVNNIEGTGIKLDHNFRKVFDTACRNLENLLGKRIAEDIHSIVDSSDPYSLLHSYTLLSDLDRVHTSFTHIMDIMMVNATLFGKQGPSIVEQILNIRKGFYEKENRFKKHFVELMRAKESTIELLSKKLNDCKEQTRR